MEMALLLFLHLDQFKGFSFSPLSEFQNSRSKKPLYFFTYCMFSWSDGEDKPRRDDFGR